MRLSVPPRGMVSLGSGECASAASIDEMTDCTALSANPIIFRLVGGSPDSSRLVRASHAYGLLPLVQVILGGQLGPNLQLRAATRTVMRIKIPLEPGVSFGVPTNRASEGAIRVNPLATIPSGRSLAMGDSVTSRMPGLRLTLWSRSTLQHSRSGQGGARSPEYNKCAEYRLRRKDAQCGLWK